jgi:uncharacterized membrane protein YeaQ/YmgE (transglycosylase-associated protein family)
MGRCPIAGEEAAPYHYLICRYRLYGVSREKSHPQHQTKGNIMDHGIIAWLIIGAVAGWLAGVLVKGGGFGLLADILIGIVGAVIGGWLAGLLGIAVGGGILASIITATLGAIILLVIVRAFSRRA